MHPRAAEFRERARERHGLDLDVEEFPEGTRTAADAAAALGCEVAQIASSIVFVTGDGPVVVVTSGANRVSEAKLAALLDVDERTLRTADPDEARAAVGYAIGGVPPFCHDGEALTYMDDTLLGFDTVYAAAGTPEAVFPIDPDRLQQVTGAEPVDVAE
jgi:prolyl-tRNA editing enzyme YbaK/EbsC (Cys-tRNA(Pro) deacylase)